MNVNEELVFAEALEKADPRERAEFLERACGGDAALRAAVESLLAAYPAGGFLEVPAVQRPVGEQGEQVPSNATQAESANEEDATMSLEFLTPPQKPGSLGRLAHYEVLEVIGQGGMGIVLRAFDEKLHRVVAIKVMAPALAGTSPPRKRFLREARAAAAVRHDHVVDIHAVEEQPIPYLVMEYVSGETLQQKLDRVGPLEVPEVLRLGQQIARGLAAAHAEGLIHRDIKPSNILLEKGAEERVKITDFGLARAAADASLTQSGVIVGTPMYMAPEQTLGDAIDHRADLFSLGSVLYTMVSGRPPFRATTSMATLKRVAEDTPRPIREIIPEVPQWLCDIIARLHAKRPEDRFQSAKEVADLFGQHLAHLAHPSLAAMPAPLSPLRIVPVVAETPQQTPFPSPSGGEKLGSGGEKLGVRGQHRRRWPIAAAILLVLLGGLSLTEAIGVTNLRGTVIRIFTPDGTLVVEVDDPGVKVTVEGDGGLVITGAGLEEIRLKPGSYKVHADRDGKPIPLERELISIAKGGREVVKVKIQAAPALRTAKAAAGAFVVVGGGKERKFDTLAEAVQRADNDDTIEVRDNGPFVTAPIKVRSKLTIRAGDRFRPVFELPAEDWQAPALLQADAALVLEGLEFRRVDERKPDDLPWRQLLIVSKALHAANCRFVTRQTILHIAARSAAVTELRNCEFLCGPTRSRTGDATPTALHLWAGRRLVLDNSVVTGQILQRVGDPGGASIRLTRNTFRSGEDATFRLNATHLNDYGEPPEIWTAERLRVEASSNLFRAQDLLEFIQGPKVILPPGEAEKRLARILDWQGERNAFAFDGVFLRHTGYAPRRPLPPAKLPEGLAGWKQLWGTAEADSVEGPVGFHGGNILARLDLAPEKLTPEDFRLRPGSAGYRAGKDKKDLGADVDLVGPGAAYERWKKTPEYQQWLKETGQLKVKTQPPTDPGAFVLLGGKGVAERKFDTLAEAVRSASESDIIEIRGNGPFVTDPLNLDGQALTIRAGAGFRPVVTLGKKHAQGPATALTTKALLVLEGIDFQLPTPPSKEVPLGIFLASEGPLWIANCRFGAKTPAYQDCISATSPRIVVRNCEFLTAAVLPFHVGCLKRMRCDIQNCLHAGQHFLGMDHYGRGDDVEIRLTNNTLVSGTAALVYFGVAFDPAKEKADRPIRLEASGNLLDALGIFHIYPGTSNNEVLAPADAEKITRSVLAWQDRENLYAATGFMTWHDKGPDHALKSLAEWKKFWGKAADDAREGKLRYQGGNLPAKLRAGPGNLTPADFRLRPDSAGYRGAKDKKDLGADVDVVGPGAAYERWKKTPEYQQWLKDTGQPRGLANE